MTAHLTRCHCEECRTLDRLPARRHGIPGAFQTTFDIDNDDGIDWPEVEPYRPTGPRKAQATPEALPLFIGALDPVLF